MNRSLLVVTGLQREARAARGTGIETICSGGDSLRLADMLGELKASAFWGVVSFGLAGGLDPELEPGDLVLGGSVAHQGDSFGSCAGTDRRAAKRRCLLATCACSKESMLGVDAAVMTPDHKASLRAKSGALAVDMESHVAARWARNHDLPFSIVRVVSDPAHRALPPIAATALKPNGDVDIFRVLSGLARAPRQLGALASAGRDSRAAFAALDGAGPCLGSRPAAYMPAAKTDEEFAVA